MQNSIDFQELRRKERQRIRSSKHKSNGGCVTFCCSDDKIGTTKSNGELSVPLPLNQSNSDACTLNTESSLESYQSILPHNHLSRDIHQLGSPTTIDSVFYAQNFLFSEQAREIMSWLSSIPEYSQHGTSRGTSGIRQTEKEESVQHNGKWTRLKHARRKVALFDGTICNLPIILQRLSNTLVAIGAFPSTHAPNHVLVNEYQPGEGIMPHTDGPAYESRTATISLGGSDVIFKLWPRQQQHDTELHSPAIQPVKNLPSLEVILHGNGSLVLFTNDAYLNHCHEICEGILEETTSSNGVCGNDVNGGTLVKRGHRTSLTFRCKK
mmetsp:Transcript_28615/g.61047  ORF Transcript_28615/g.61047 Transcript_28615/m.61047 type:complete len:324 (-) Transcript_28615:21-992(-)